MSKFRHKYKYFLIIPISINIALFHHAAYSASEQIFETTYGQYDGQFGALLIEADTRPIATPDEFSDTLLTSWNTWNKTELTFSLNNTQTDDRYTLIDSGDTPEFDEAAKNGFRNAFRHWEDVIGITFTEVTSDADIEIVNTNIGGYAWARGPLDKYGVTKAQAFFSAAGSPFDPSEIGTTSFGTALHEIGHTLGLGHPFDGGSAWANNTGYSSIMSYIEENDFSYTPMSMDIYTVQRVYGANMSTRTGDTIYGFNSNADSDFYHFDVAEVPYLSIWDAGGNDTLDVSGWSIDQSISLVAGEFSSVAPRPMVTYKVMQSSLSIAYGVTIENAKAGSGNDHIRGNVVNNIIHANAGNDIIYGSTGDDTLYGGSGQDTVSYADTVYDFSFNVLDASTIEISHLTQGFSDIIYDVESFSFDGVTYSFDHLATNTNYNLAPTLSSLSVQSNPNQSYDAATTIIANDPNRDALIYTIYDSKTHVLSGHFALDGLSFEAGGYHQLTEEEFDRLKIVGGVLEGTEILSVSVSDGEFSSTETAFNLITGGGVNFAPAWFSMDVFLAPGAVGRMSSIANGQDANGDELNYWVRDHNLNATSSYFLLDGDRLTAGFDNAISAEQLQRLELVAGDVFGAEIMTVTMSDGELSSTQSLSVNVANSANLAPIVQVQNLLTDIKTTTHVASYVQAIDQNGDVLTYTLRDDDVADFSAYFLLDGVRLTAGANHSLSAEQLLRLKITGGDVEGVNSMLVQISDGELSTSWQQFNVITGDGVNEVPGGVAMPIQLFQNTPSLIAFNFLIHDVDGDVLTYHLRDNGFEDDSSYLSLDGIRQNAGTELVFTEQEFARLKVVGGRFDMTETLSFRASDAELNGGWTDVDVITGYGINLAPSLNVQDIEVVGSEEFLVKDYISTSDYNGDLLTFSVRDDGVGIGSAYLSLNGVNLGAGVEHTLSQEEFNNLKIFAGTVSGVESFSFNVSDGNLSSGWQSAMITTTQGSNGAPWIRILMIPSNIYADIGSSDFMHLYFDAGDPDENSITYTVRDNGLANSSGHLLLDGVRLNSGTEHTLSDSEFQRLEIVGGNVGGTDTFDIRVSDASADSDWLNFNLITGNGDNFAPTVLAQSFQSYPYGFNLAIWFINASDPDGNILSYILRDNGLAESSGYFALNGTRLSAGIEHSLSSSEFQLLEVFGGSVDGTEMMDVRVSDTELFSDWATITLTTGDGINLPPSIDVQDIQVSQGLSNPVLWYLTASDPDGNALTYIVRDNGLPGSSGYFSLDGVRLGSGVEHKLTSAEIARLEIVGGSFDGTEMMEVRVSDTELSSEWVSFNLVTGQG